MAKKIAEYRKEIVRALKAAGNYNKSLEMQIRALSSAMRTLDLAGDEIDRLEVTTVMERTRYGEKMAPHPAFKVQRDAQESVTRQMKALGLTAAELQIDAESDPLVELTREIRETSGGIIHPDTEEEKNENF